MPRLFLLLLLMFLPSVAAWAAEGDAARAAMQKLAPMQQLKGFRISALPGYYEGVIGGQVVYASLDGRYLIRGQVDDTVRGENLSEASMAVRRLEVLAGIGDDQRLRYVPPKPRHLITVFTDVDCPYCKRLHAQITEYAALGIGIDYLFFPLATHPDAQRKSAHVWCAPDRNAAYDAIMAGTTLDRRQCANPVTATVAAGKEIGVAATPTAIGPDGRVIPSTVLMSPHRLLDELNRIAAAAAVTKEKTP